MPIGSSTYLKREYRECLPSALPERPTLPMAAAAAAMASRSPRSIAGLVPRGLLMAHLSSPSSALPAHVLLIGLLAVRIAGQDMPKSFCRPQNKQVETDASCEFVLCCLMLHS